jgi:hypothetical protein
MKAAWESFTRAEAGCQQGFAGQFKSEHILCMPLEYARAGYPRVALGACLQPARHFMLHSPPFN